MTDGAKDSLDALFAGALERPAAERAAFLAEACPHDPELRAEVASLLAAHDEAEGVLGESVGDFAAPLLQGLTDALRREEEAMHVGARIGPWRILEEVGRGGMGAVYRAVRADGAFHRQVALKLVKRGMDTDEILRRFRYERRILAGLDHPNIARLLDGGATDDGRPFLVMEFVEGRPIDRYCDEEGLDVSARLALFAEVCRAVDHAHRSLVVHRDLKPGNILVGPEPTVKLLDFGIAKLLSDQAGPASPHTRTDIRIHTPAYAAPEQLRGEPVTTATDVHALGVILFRLLTGEFPHGPPPNSLYQVERSIVERMPSRPSRVVTRGETTGRPAPWIAGPDEPTPEARARVRGTTPAALRRRLRGDLDRILLKALDPEPARRYPSAAALAEDLRRHLAGEPVLARGGGALYLAGRFARRHRAGVAVAAAGVLALAGYVATLSASAERLERERARVDMEARRAEGVTSFLVDLFQDPELRGVAGDTLTARAVLDRGAQRLWVGEEGLDPDARAAALLAIGRAYRGLGNTDLALPVLEEVVGMRRLRGEDPAGLAEALAALAWARSDAHHAAAADTLFREAIELQGSLPDTDSVRLAYLLLARGTVMRDVGEPEEALALVRDGAALWERHAPPGHAELPGILHDLGFALTGVGDLAGAETVYRRSIELRRSFSEPDLARLARTLNNLGVVVRDLGRHEEAEAIFREAHELAGEALGADHPRTLVKGMHLARQLERRGASAEAEGLLRAQVERVRERWGPTHWSVGQGWTRVGDLLFQVREDPAAAESPYREAARLYAEGLGADHAWTGQARRALGEVLLGLERFDEAEVELRAAEAILLANAGPGSPEVTRVRAALEGLVAARR
jgi:eukaryotic-like serine/threonine-protein kinase